MCGPGLMRIFCWLVAVTVAFVIVACGGDGAPTSTPATSPRSLTPTTAATLSPTRAPPLATVAPLPGSLAIINARILDGTGAPAIESGHVIVRDGYIVEVGDGEGDLPANAQVIDAAGRTVMPGLGDGHVHTTQAFVVSTGYLTATINEDAYLPFLRAGFTNLRDVGTATIILKAIKGQTDIQTRLGNAPRITWAGPLITAPDGYPFTVPRYSAGGQEVTSIDEAVDLVDNMASSGARVIKLALEHGYFRDDGWAVLDLETVLALTGAAHERGLRVTAHVTSLDEVRLALDGGVDDLAHTPLEPLTDELIAEMLESGMAMVTTATIWGAPDEPARAVIAENAARYAEAGGIVALGTDWGCCDQIPGGAAYLAEASFLAAQGYPAAELVVAATRNAAIVSNAGDTTGTLEPGKLADIIIVDGEPDVDIASLANVDVVILGGQVVSEAPPPQSGLPFRVCSRDENWTRPSEPEMAAGLWQDPRYRVIALDQRLQVLSEHFYRSIDSSSLSGPWIALTGLGQWPPTDTDECGTDSERQHATRSGVIEVWMLLYEPLRLDHETDGFVLHVRQLDRGYRAVQFGSREDSQEPVTIVDEQGAELACLGGSAAGGRCR